MKKLTSNIKYNQFSFVINFFLYIFVNWLKKYNSF
jgi:hypothetical protein